jgi:hypothetical protein
MPKPNTEILKHLKEQGRNIDLPLNILREFKEFEKDLYSELKSYDELPDEISYAMRCFLKLQMLGMASTNEQQLGGAKRCLDHLMKDFNNDSSFSDGITILSWFLFNFPTQPHGLLIANEVIRSAPELAAELEPFVTEGVRSRLGLYEVRINSKKSSKLKELFTGNNINLSHPLETPPGDIALLRVMKIKGGTWVFGDTKEFPANKKEEIIDMVSKKMTMYFPHDDPKKSYDAMMRLAGPYWFSIVASDDYQGGILDPDYYTSYYHGF